MLPLYAWRNFLSMFFSYLPYASTIVLNSSIKLGFGFKDIFSYFFVAGLIKLNFSMKMEKTRKKIQEGIFQVKWDLIFLPSLLESNNLFEYKCWKIMFETVKIKFTVSGFWKMEKRCLKKGFHLSVLKCFLKLMELLQLLLSGLFSSNLIGTKEARYSQSNGR